ncbi:phenylalanine 4-monooxygenase [Ignavibacterium album]|uniref:phenylalanine 4-monooxygenase n=1 Tax=Ignavibacterium album TaxID=591197 RepID=UPI0026EECDFD|nr:phenylalanine 4-monooxygenase [Ignavibacterium album]
MGSNSKAEKILSAYEKAAQEGIDPRCIPQKLKGPVPIHDEIVYPEYTEEEQSNWKFLYNRQMSFLPGRACDEYIDGAKALNLSSDRIPHLKEISHVFNETTGWKVARVPGLIDVEDFFGLISKRIFPSTDYIRTKEELDYTPAPDLFHDIFGHMPLLTNTNFASFYQQFGIASLNATGIDRKYLETLHWFTVEFGLIKKPEGMRIYGAGILSSLGEVQHALSNDVEVREFDPDKIVVQEYDVWHLQPVLFAIESFEQLEDGFKSWTKRKKLLN